MTIQALMRMPTTIDNIHESVYRSYNTLRYVEHLLEAGTPAPIILELLREINDFPTIKIELTNTSYNVSKALAGVA
jgi:hypothetical protein